MKLDSNNYGKFTIFILILVGVSAGITYLVSVLLQSYGITVPWYIETPSVPAVYGTLFVFFDKYFWKFSIFKKLGIIVAENLNGKWIGVVKSSYDAFATDIPATLQIKQTATCIKICGIFDKSKSVSIHESFGKSDVDNKVALFYFFRNEPQYDAASTMAMHEGSAKLTYDPNENTLVGYYYSGRDRNNHGTIKVKRIIP